MALALLSAGPVRAADPAADFHDGLIFVRVAIGDGPPGVFLLDTGAGVSVLDARFAQAAKVKLGDSAPLAGGGGVTEARQAEDVRLTLAGGPSALVDPVVSDLSQAARGMGVRLDGILGDDFLRRFLVTLDYRAHRVSLDTTLAAPPPDAVRLGFVRTPYVVARARDGGREVQAVFQVDTGANVAVSFWRPFAAQVFPGARGAVGQGLGVAGQTTTRIHPIESLIVAGRTIAAPRADFADDLHPDDAGPGYGGVIGGPAWSGLTLTLDFLHGRMWVR